MTTCYLADPTDTTVRLFDFADPSGANNPGTVQTRLVGLDAGAYPPELGLFAPDTGDGSFRTRRRAPSTDMTIQLRTTAADQDTHRKAINRLFSLLEVPRVVVYQGDGMAEAVHIATLGASNVEQLLRGGQSNWDLIVRQFEDVQMDLVVARQPIILLASELSSDANRLTNPFMMYDQDGLNGARTGTAAGWVFRITSGVPDTTGIAAQSTGGQADGQSFTITAGTTKDFTQDVVSGVSPEDVFAGQFVFEADSGITASVAIQYLTGGGNLLGTETVSAPAVGNGKEQRLTVVSAPAPATSAQVRIKLRIANTSGATKTVVLRRAQIEKAATASRFRASTETVPNDPASTRGRNLLFWNDGEASVPVKTVVTVHAESAVQASIVGKRSQFGVTGLRRIGDLQETRYVQAEASERGWTVVLGADTTTAGPDADASGTGANFVRTTHATAPAASLRRFRATRTTGLDSLRGRFKVYGRFRPSTTPKQYAVRLKWSPSLADPALNVEPEVLLDTYSRTGDAATPTITQGFVEVELGSFELPLDPSVELAGIALEVWSRVVLPDPPTASNLDLDHLWLVPADAAGNEDSVGMLFIGGSSTDRIVGKALTSPPLRLTAPGVADPAWISGANQGNAKRLNYDFEAAGYGPNIGTAFGVGRHRATFTLTDKLTGTREVKVRVTNVTDDDETIVNSYAGKVPSTVVLEWHGVAGKSYQPMIGITNYGAAQPGNAGFLDVQAIRYEFIPSLGASESFRSDPGERYVAERLDGASALVGSANASGELPFFADRGLNFMSFRQDDIPLNYYIDRQNLKARTAAVSFVYRPGWYEL